MALSFGHFSMDVAQRLLVGAGVESSRLWPDTFVSEGNLPTYIRTVYGFGYAFIGEVIESQTAADDSGHAGLSSIRIN